MTFGAWIDERVVNFTTNEKVQAMLVTVTKQAVQEANTLLKADIDSELADVKNTVAALSKDVTSVAEGVTRDINGVTELISTTVGGLQSTIQGVLDRIPHFPGL